MSRMCLHKIKSHINDLICFCIKNLIIWQYVQYRLCGQPLPLLDATLGQDTENYKFFFPLVVPILVFSVTLSLVTWSCSISLWCFCDPAVVLHVFKVFSWIPFTSLCGHFVVILHHIMVVLLLFMILLHRIVVICISLRSYLFVEVQNVFMVVKLTFQRDKLTVISCRDFVLSVIHPCGILVSRSLSKLISQRTFAKKNVRVRALWICILTVLDVDLSGTWVVAHNVFHT